MEKYDSSDFATPPGQQMSNGAPHQEPRRRGRRRGTPRMWVSGAGTSGNEVDGRGARPEPARNNHATTPSAVRLEAHLAGMPVGCGHKFALYAPMMPTRAIWGVPAAPLGTSPRLRRSKPEPGARDLGEARGLSDRFRVEIPSDPSCGRPWPNPLPSTFCRRPSYPPPPRHQPRDAGAKRNFAKKKRRSGNSSRPAKKWCFPSCVGAALWWVKRWVGAPNRPNRGMVGGAPGDKRMEEGVKLGL